MRVPNSSNNGIWRNGRARYSHCPSCIDGMHVSAIVGSGMECGKFANTVPPDASTPPTRATEHMGTQRDINRQVIHTTHCLHSQYRFGAISRISAIATPALLAQAARSHAAHTTARIPARAHRGCPTSPPDSTLAPRSPRIRGPMRWPPAARDVHARDRERSSSSGCSAVSHRCVCLPRGAGG